MKFQFVGNGFCRSRCHVIGHHPCSINQYYKGSSNINECKLACENEVECTGFAISDSTFKYPNDCTIYGNVSSANVQSWTNPDAWRAKPISTYGYEGFKINSSTGESGCRCFKRIDEEKNDNSKFSSLGQDILWLSSSSNMNLISNWVYLYYSWQQVLLRIPKWKGWKKWNNVSKEWLVPKSIVMWIRWNLLRTFNWKRSSQCYKWTMRER